MAIQNRRGQASKFVPSKLLPGEFAVVQSGDSSTTDGKALYLAFDSGSVKRLVTETDITSLTYDLENDIESVSGDLEELASTVGNVSSTAESALIQANANQAAISTLESSLNTTIGNVRSTAESALAKANANEGSIAEAHTAITNLQRELENVSIDPDDLGLYQDPDTGYVYPTYRNVVSENGIPLASGGGGGGGGGSTTNAVLTVANETGWLSKTIAYGADCLISINWSSIEDDLPTGNGSIRITIGNVVKTSYGISQGIVSVNLKPYLSKGENKVKVRISDVYDQSKTITFTVTATELSISSTFDPSLQYDGSVTFPYTPVGELEKTIYFILDGSVFDTVVMTASNRQFSVYIPNLSHGSHTLRVYFTAVVNDQTVTSNELYYQFMSVNSSENTPIVTTQYTETEVEQFTTVIVPYQVYTPNSLTSPVSIYVNNVLNTSLTVDRTTQTFSYRADNSGTLKIKIQTGSVYKELTITVGQSDIDVEAETENLALYLSSYGRSNSESTPGTWTFGEGSSEISATFSGFNWVSDGWVSDAEGITVLRCSGTARVTIPYKPFIADFGTTGKTIEIEFATRNVLDYDAVIMSCFSNNRGFKLTAQKAMLKSEQTEISTQYKEDEHVRIAFVAEKKAEHRLLYVYINGIASGVVQYGENDNFMQNPPVNISIGSSDCTIDVYCIRIYNNNLSRYQIVDNWIADTQVGLTMLERYNRNNVFDEYGNIVTDKLPNDLPYMIISCPQLPQSKGDKKTCSGTFIDPLTPSRSFTFTNCTIDVQGTSSQYYPRKNYKMKFNDGFNMTLSGETQSKFAMNEDAIPVKTFCMKADFASSEGANNVELVRLYNEACPYKTPAQVEDDKVRQGIDGFPMLIFWNDTAENTTSFIGKYNFNNDKSTEEVFGFADPDESWEILNNASDRVLFKSGDFSGDGWKSDFEPRYPDTDPMYEDKAQLAEFVAWAASTDTTAATGNALPQSVTYDGVTYTTDSSAYRLAKFKAEAGDYMEMQSALFYYLFTELFLMVDSRAKNAFPSFIGSEVSA